MTIGYRVAAAWPRTESSVGEAEHAHDRLPARIAVIVPYHPIGQALFSGRRHAAGAVDRSQQQLGGDRLNLVAAMPNDVRTYSQTEVEHRSAGRQGAKNLDDEDRERCPWPSR